MPQINGSDSESIEAFDQKNHKLMLDSAEKIADGWIKTLKQQRANSERAEQLIVEKVGKLQHVITEYFKLGMATTAEAKRTDAFIAQLVSELDKLGEARQ